MANNTGIKYGGRQKRTANKATARLKNLDNIVAINAYKLFE